jgi:hypothetical protein
MFHKSFGAVMVLYIVMSFVSLSEVNAQESSSNFSISPPPIPWFEFQSNQQDLRVGATGFYIQGKDNSDLKIYGGGGNFIWRGGLSDYFALDVGGAIMYARGDVAADTPVTMYMFNPTANMEIQLFNTQWVCMILFGGGNFSWMRMSMDTPMGSMSVVNGIIGPQAGLQISLKLGPFSLSPFFMYQGFVGSASYSMGDYYGNSHIDYYSTYSYGFDIVYVPWNITLSSLLQMKPNSSDDMNMYIFTISYDVRWGIDEKAAEETTVQE